MFGLDENRKLGIGLCLLGMGCFFTGVLFFFDRMLLSLANLAFLAGLGFLLGPMKAFRFFFRREKAIGSASFFIGLFVILRGWGLIGLILQSYGVWKLFAAFLPNVVQALKLIPGMGFVLGLPGIRNLADYAYDQRRLPL